MHDLEVGVEAFAAVVEAHPHRVEVVLAPADTETQAVQLAMLILLSSIFFGGFFLPLESLWGPVRAIGYLLPVTFSSLDLRDVMLVKAVPTLISLTALAGLGVACYIVGAWQFSRRMSIQ